MPLPRISGVLNNCALHVLTPELRTQINLLADADSAMPREFMPTYELLKAEFAEFYQIQPDNFTWPAFDALLAMHNDFDLQMILGPVLRNVMAKNMQHDRENANLTRLGDDGSYLNGVTLRGDETDNELIHLFIHYKTSIQPNGRYVSLSPDEMFKFVASHFGLAVVVHQDDQVLRYPNDPEQEPLFEHRPCVEMFHQGGVAGAEAGGHYERTLNAQERVDYEYAENVHLRIVAGFFKLDSIEMTEIAKHLLQIYMAIHVRTLALGTMDKLVMLSIFHKTVAQIEKFLYNRLYVDDYIARCLLGDLTDEANSLISIMPPQGDMEYDNGILTLIKEHVYFDKFTPPAKLDLLKEQYEIALTLLTPPVPQEQAHDYNPLDPKPRWALRANEISALQDIANEYAEKILFDQGLSVPLYELCNREEIAQALQPEFLALLASDPDFQRKAHSALRLVVANRPIMDSHIVTTSERIAVCSVESDVDAQFTDLLLISPFRRRIQSNASTPPHSAACDIADIYGSDNVEQNIVPEDANALARILQFSNPKRKLIFGEEETKQNTDRVASSGSQNRRATNSSSDRLFPNVPLTYQVRTHSEPPSSQENASFWLRAIQTCLAIGGICAVVAVLTCPPVAAGLGVSTVLGVAVSDIAVTASFLAGTSFLLAASMFAVKQAIEDPIVPPSSLRLGGGGAQ